MLRKLQSLCWLVALLVLATGTAALRAEGTNRVDAPVTPGLESTNQLELIRRLLQRVDELEQKVKLLESAHTTPQPTNDGKAAQQVQELGQKVKDLEQQRQLDQEALEAKAKTAPRISIGGEGFSFSSANGDFGIRLRGLLQIDTRTFFDDPAVSGNNEFLLRRARPILQGTVFRDFDFMFAPDFAPSSGPTIYDAFLNYKYSPELQFQGGKFKVPIGLEQLQPDKDTLFVERGMPNDLVPSRDVGFMLHGDLLDARISYAAGIFNGTRDGGNSGNTDFGGDRAFVGRLFFQPLKKSPTTALQGLGFGLAGSYEHLSSPNGDGLPSANGNNVSGYLTTGQQQFFDYAPADGADVLADSDHWRLAPQGYYYYGPVGLLGEYVISDQGVTRTGVAPFSSAHLQNTSWSVAVSWVLTGEHALYAGGLVPARPFDPAQGHWGAWQLVGRYGELNIDSDAFPLYADSTTSANSAMVWAFGINWFLNQNVEVRTGFSHTHFRGGGMGSSAPGTITHQDEDVLFTRLQLAF